MNEPREVRYQRARRRGAAAAWGGGLAALAVLATPAGAAWVAAIARSWTGTASGVPSALATAAAAMLTAVMWRMAMLPGAVWAGGGRASLEVALMAAPVAAATGLAVAAGVALTGPRWWVLLAALVAGSLAAAMVYLPAWMARAWRAAPVERPALVERLGALARRVRVPIASIDRVPAGSGRRVTAMVAGAGDSRRVFVGDELMRDWRDEEIAVVVAHELAHHAHHDLWKSWALDALVIAGACGAADALVQAAAPARGLAGPADPAAVPLALFAAVAAWSIASPARLALSRHQERRADAFALQMTNDAAAFRAAVRRLAASHQAEERPSRMTRWFFLRHPPVAARLAAADRFEGNAIRD